MKTQHNPNKTYNRLPLICHFIYSTVKERRFINQKVKHLIQVLAKLKHAHQYEQLQLKLSYLFCPIHQHIQSQQSNLPKLEIKFLNAYKHNSCIPTDVPRQYTWDHLSHIMRWWRRMNSLLPHHLLSWKTLWRWRHWRPSHLSARSEVCHGTTTNWWRWWSG